MVEVIKLDTVDKWEVLKGSVSAESELIIFKYSPVCPISSVVDGDLKAWLQALPAESKMKCAMVNVLESKDVSLKIAEDLNIKHQSPQAIWVTEGLKVKWFASHYDITKSKLTAILNKA